jgi:hypothetical protein
MEFNAESIAKPPAAARINYFDSLYFFMKLLIAVTYCQTLNKNHLFESILVVIWDVNKYNEHEHKKEQLNDHISKYQVSAWEIYFM